MNALLAFCGTCYQIPNSSGIQFFLTSCGNVICQKCLARQSSCTKCGASCSKTLISNQMNANVAVFFKDTGNDFQVLQRTMTFQNSRYKVYIKYSNARMAHMERTLKEMNNKIQSLEIEKKALQTSLAKSNERNISLERQRQSSRELPGFHMVRSQASSAPPANGNESQFMNHLMEALDQPNPNNSINTGLDFGASPHGIFPRNTSRNSFENSLNRTNRSGGVHHGGVGSNINPVNVNLNPPRSVRFASTIQTNRTFQSTPIVGHEQVGLHNFVPRRSSSSSSIIRKAPSSIAGGNRYIR